MQLSKNFISLFSTAAGESQRSKPAFQSASVLTSHDSYYATEISWSPRITVLVIQWIFTV